MKNPDPVSVFDSTSRLTFLRVSRSVLRVEFDNLIVRRADGKEVRLHIDENTDMIGYVGPGERIEAKVSNLVDRKHAMSIRQLE